MSKVTLVIPCYNEEERLDGEALLAFSLAGHDLTLLLVNDGSRDGTLQLLERLRDRAPERVQVLDVQPNQGKAEAVRRGVLAAAEGGADYVGFWDADLATPLEELPRFTAVLDDRPQVELVFGARVKLVGRQIRRSPGRHYIGRVFATAISSILSLPIYDSQCGAKLFRTGEALQVAWGRPFGSRWIFDVELLARYLIHYRAQGVELAERLVELPLHTWIDVPGSKVKWQDGLVAMRDLGSIWWRYLRG